MINFNNRVNHFKEHINMTQDFSRPESWYFSCQPEHDSSMLQFNVQLHGIHAYA